MHRLQIYIQRNGQRRQIVLGGFFSVMVTVVLALVVIVAAGFALVLGYLALGLVLAIVIIALCVAVLRAAWSTLGRSRDRPRP